MCFRGRRIQQAKALITLLQNQSLTMAANALLRFGGTKVTAPTRRRIVAINSHHRPHQQHALSTSSFTWWLLRSPNSTTTTLARAHFSSRQRVRRLLSTTSSLDPSSTTSLSSSLKDGDKDNDTHIQNDATSSSLSVSSSKGKKSKVVGRLSSDALTRLVQLARPEWQLIGMSAATLGITSSITLLLPYASGQVIDYVVATAASAAAATSTNSSDALSPLVLASGLFGLSTVAGGGVYLRALWLARAGNRIVARLKQQLFDSILQQEHAYLDQQTSGDLLSRLTTDAALVEEAVTSQAVAVLRHSIMTIGAMSMLLYTSPLLAAISCGTLPPIFVLTTKMGQRLEMEQEKVQELQGAATTLAEEAVSSVSTVKQFVAEQFESTRYRNAIAKAHDRALETAHMQAQLEAGAHVASNGAVLCVLGYGGSMVLEGSISAGELTGFIMYSLLLAGNVSGLTWLYSDLVRAGAASKRVFDILDRTPMILPSSSSLTSKESASLSSTMLQQKSTKATMDALDPLEQFEFTPTQYVYDHSQPTVHPVSIELESVNFRYPSRPQVQVLENFSLSVAPGEVVALVGGSGSGKSTISSLLTRLYDVNDEYKDSVRIAGIPVSQYDPLQLRRMIGVVSQEPTMFRGTIRDNIAYGEWSRVSDDQIWQAAKAAHVLDFTKDFPMGLDTLVGARGSQLSGGQRQRIAIARVLVKNPPIVILDEATSALDAKSEHVVQNAMNSLMSGRTVLSIAHRLSTIRHASRIAVVEQGAIVQTGTFDELTSQEGGHFRDLMKTQLVSDDV
jgi:ABC-type multidrug transport system fused ATPase/permease subunit